MQRRAKDFAKHAANDGERTAIAELLSEITAAKLSLPGDPSRRPLTFRAQPFDR